MKRLSIAISGINATDNPGPGVPVAKSLNESRMDFECIGLSYDTNDPGNYLHGVFSKSYILPYPTSGWQGIHQQLLKIKKHSGLDMIIPCLDAELPLYIKYQEELAKDGIHTFLPTSQQFKLRNKRNLSEFSGTIGLWHPKTICVFSIDELYSALQEISFPVAIKGQYYKAMIARNTADACKYFNSISDEWGLPVLVQQVVEGEEINLIGVGIGDGNDLGLVAMKKLTTTSLGKIWSGVSIHNEALLTAARSFLEKSKWRGPFELECIANGEDIYLIEINPRFPAWAYFATGLGINLPERMIQFVLDQNPSSASFYSAGKLFVRFTDEIICDMDNFSTLITTGESHEQDILKRVV
jgi:carbamoyl-phosphate synthase large subunit